jgi:hypothetical protein
MADFDARENLHSVVRSILAGDRPSRSLLDAAGDALERQKARSGESVDEWAERLAADFNAPRRAWVRL